MLPALLVSLRIQLMKPELAMPNNMMAYGSSIITATMRWKPLISWDITRDGTFRLKRALQTIATTYRYGQNSLDIHTVQSDSFAGYTK